MKVAVIGAGSIGVATAWWLQQAGFEVTVIERHRQVSLESSRFGGGLLSIGHARPWAQPTAPLQLLKGLFQDHAPMMFRPRLDPQQWLWGAAFLRQCLPANTHANILSMVRLAEYSKRLLKQLSQQLEIEFDYRRCGVLSIYRQPHELARAESSLDRLRNLGIERRLLTTDEVIALEPSLAHTATQIIGGDFSAQDAVGDAHTFTQSLAKHVQQQGAQFLFNTQVTRMVCAQGAVQGLEVINAEGEYEHLQFDNYVVATGAESGLLLQQAGLPYRLYPVKGYSALFRLVEPHQAPLVGVYDPALRLSFARFGSMLRVSGFAELSGLNRALNDYRCQLIVQHTQRYFGAAIAPQPVQLWSGLRSATPSNVPLIGRTTIHNLYLNTGHSNLGWTMSVGSAKLLADLLARREPELDFPYLYKRAYE